MVEFEETELSPEETGLDFYVFPSLKWNHTHNARIRTSKQLRYDAKTAAVVELYPEIRIIEGQLSDSDLANLKNWINVNYEMLIKYWNEEFDYFNYDIEEFLVKI